ncbi:MAG TPA: hypothetical protein VJ719_07750 [Chthoniobacterales bacterium]|nr:hypothetical protein [Chthoniobacterales bacterium]
MARMLRGIALFSLAVAISAMYAELPPQVYRQYQDEAPEAVSLTVRSVKQAEKEEKEFTLISIVAEARIDKVTRSASGLRPGDVIRIEYQHRKDKEPVPGPSQPDIVAEGKTYPAFLRKQSDGSYGIAAGGFSFKPAR